jgi:hypothetical protein
MYERVEWHGVPSWDAGWLCRDAPFPWLVQIRGEKRHAGLLHAGEHVPGMRARVDLSKDVGNDAVFIDNIGDAARQTGAASAIGLAQDMLRIAQERETEAGIVGKGSVVFDRIKADAENLHVALCEGVIEGEEPAPFGGSPPGAGFGIKPQDDLFATEIP